MQIQSSSNSVRKCGGINLISWSWLSHGERINLRVEKWCWLNQVWSHVCLACHSAWARYLVNISTRMDPWRIVQSKISDPSGAGMMNQRCPFHRDRLLFRVVHPTHGHTQQWYMDVQHGLWLIFSSSCRIFLSHSCRRLMVRHSESQLELYTSILRTRIEREESVGIILISYSTKKLRRILNILAAVLMRLKRHLSRRLVQMRGLTFIKLEAIMTAGENWELRNTLSNMVKQCHSQPRTVRVTLSSVCLHLQEFPILKHPS